VLLLLLQHGQEAAHAGAGLLLLLQLLLLLGACLLVELETWLVRCMGACQSPSNSCCNITASSGVNCSRPRTS
jgi:hypothetical protein